MSQGQVSARKKSVNVKPTVRQQRDCDCVRGQDDKALEAKQWNDREDREIICMKFFYKFIVLIINFSSILSFNFCKKLWGTSNQVLS